MIDDQDKSKQSPDIESPSESESVELGDASPPANTESPDKKYSKLATEEFQNFANEMLLREQELGFIGKIIGGRAEKAGNVGFIVVIFAFVMLLVCIFWAIFVKSHSQLIEYVFGGVFSIIMLALGYIFGVHTNVKNGKNNSNVESR
ncbi:MAG: hypothetical protein F4039_06690 [Gammaproteobacteria bacterium]|nr:hypothetical protein [Gammaproteobacteria bacterium]MYF53424.1 hypothetical protein [Gammaproteobacteria bacterium]MYK43756.1 hypothetical protein [Gammaproteobacteria bacterium]